jgi:predicted metalloprotease with PDZ domain
MWTRSLWFAEGVTNTYEVYTLVRTGLWSTQEFYTNLAAQIDEVESHPAHRWQSAEQSSLDAWYEKYPLYNRPEESVSYYTKGQILGVTLDILIRDLTENRASLDNVLRALNVEFAQRGRFYNDSEDLRAVAESVIRKNFSASHANLDEFFRRYVSGIDEIPYADFLGLAGLAIRDTGQRRAAFGFAINRQSSGPSTVGSVEMDSEAERAGLRNGDFLLTLNGEPIPRAPERWLRDHQPGDRVTVKVRRAGQEMEFTVALVRETDAIYQISEIPEPTEKQRRIRDGILHGTTDPSR